MNELYFSAFQQFIYLLMLVQNWAHCRNKLMKMFIRLIYLESNRSLNALRKKMKRGQNCNQMQANTAALPTFKASGYSHHFPPGNHIQCEVKEKIVSVNISPKAQGILVPNYFLIHETAEGFSHSCFTDSKQIYIYIYIYIYIQCTVFSVIKHTVGYLSNP